MSDDATIPTPRPVAPLPILPRILRPDLAAIYVGMSPSTLRAEVAAGRAPQPVQMTDGLKGWDRGDLDAWIERQKAVPAARPNPWNDDPA